jgi:hypothetical protein
MDNNEEKLKVFAQTLYEIRLLLSHHLGNKNQSMVSESIAAHLAYAVHNEAVAVIENRPEDFLVDAVLSKISAVDLLFDEEFSDRLKVYLSK